MCSFVGRGLGDRLRLRGECDLDLERGLDLDLERDFDADARAGRFGGLADLEADLENERRMGLRGGGDGARSCFTGDFGGVVLGFALRA